MMLWKVQAASLATLVSFLLPIAECRNTLNLRVTAPSGTYIGSINGTVPNVRQFVGVRYAQPPINDLRWMPPVKPTADSQSIIPATDPTVACSQYGTRSPNAFNQNLYQNQPPWLGQSHTPGTMVWSSGEDCLSLAVWTPVHATNQSKLPVVVFVPGGGFVNSGSYSSSWYRPHRWVERSQDLVAVVINYRLDIMGFPNARMLDEQNLGLLDQRMALEWVRDNIEAFGGDPERITFWGESAGSVSVDYHNFAFPDDPIVTGFFMDSGSALTSPESSTVRDGSGANFSFVADHFGCGSSAPAEEVACMRNIPVYDLITFVGQYTDNSTVPGVQLPPISFLPFTDDRVVFSNYTERYALGAYSQRPAIYSTCANEFAALTSVLGLPSPPATLSRLSPGMQAIINNATLDFFLCPAAQSTIFRQQDNAVTYRFLYGGNFTNISPLPYLGPYHASDLPMLHGSFQDFNGPGPSLQYETSAIMQDLLLSFMKDPSRGVQRLGWPEASSGRMLLFGADGQAVQNVSIDRVEGACTGSGPYNPYP
ncbi:Alpha/Beta hydrolase protein [Aspergillus pseudoustus]|uniref:Alpha/Beta hydrolase protein n=1 Tax=Aspergillus pseudoustus TaxID=1810923 RepID=A0ABR4KQF0_9EURO